jgi:hypothetical protein
MPPRLGPVALTNAEKQARARQRQRELRAYVRALERAVVEMNKHIVPGHWLQNHRDTIARARTAQQQKED